MLEFINNNAVLFSGIVALTTTIITAFVTIWIKGRENKKNEINDLKTELKTTKQELESCKKIVAEYRDFEKAEKNIDKSEGSIYKETLPNGNIRSICGYCWEKEHIKIPLNVQICYEEYTKQYYYDGFCHSCETHCTCNIEPEPPESSSSSDINDEFPF